MKDYDVVLVGAGLGGLSAARALAKAGKRVLLLEKHDVPGGNASSFIRGRFEFEIALQELSGLGDENNRGPVWRILSEYGVLPRIELAYLPYQRNIRRHSQRNVLLFPTPSCSRCKALQDMRQ